MAIGVAVGYRLARGLAQVSWRAIFTRARHLIIMPVLPLALMVASLWLENRPDCQWQLPFWVQANTEALCRLLIYGCTSYVLGVLAGMHLGGPHPRKRLGLGLAIALAMAIPIVAKPEPVALVRLAEPRVSPDGTVLQSTPYTCVPAVLANLLRRYGITKTEAELAAAMGTSREGTSAGRAALELRRLGFQVSRKTRADRDLAALRPPAMLLVDYDTHVVAYFGMTNGLAEIVDPMSGRRMMSPERLARRWTGRALEVGKREGYSRSAPQVQRKR